MEPIKILTEVMNASLQIYLTNLFCSAFWHSKYKSWVTIITSAVISLFMAASLLLFKGTFYSIVLAITFCFLITFLYECKLYQKIIFSIIIFAIMIMIENIIAVGLTIGFNNDFNAAKEGLLYISGIILSKFVMFLVVLFIRIKKHKTLFPAYRKNYIYLFLFPFSSLMIIFLQYKIFVDYPNQEHFMYVLVVVVYTLLILANMIIFEFIDSLYNNTINEGRLNAASEIIANQSVQYKALLDHDRDIMKIRHDHKNLCLALLTELRNGNSATVIEKLSQEYDLCNKEFLIHNNIVYTIINTKQEVARKTNTEIELECHNLDSIKIDPIDIAILIGNALDNAIEACQDLESDSKIEVSILKKANNVFIIIKNPTKDVVNINDLTTTKKNESQKHGFGIISMKQIIEKYNGELLFFYEKPYFTVTAMLKDTQ